MEWFSLVQISLKFQTLQRHEHPATPCNSLQHPATPCNTLQHPAAPCSTPTLQHPATTRTTMQRTVTH